MGGLLSVAEGWETTARDRLAQTDKRSPRIARCQFCHELQVSISTILPRRGSFRNYVDQNLPRIDHLLTPGWHWRRNSFIVMQNLHTIEISSTTYLPRLVNVVCERPPLQCTTAFAKCCCLSGSKLIFQPNSKLNLFYQIEYLHIIWFEWKPYFIAIYVCRLKG